MSSLTMAHMSMLLSTPPGVEPMLGPALRKPSHGGPTGLHRGGPVSGCAPDTEAPKQPRKPRL